MGCASGEKPYSIAMLLAEHLGVAEFCRRVKIFDTRFLDAVINEAGNALIAVDNGIVALANIPARHLLGISESRSIFLDAVTLRFLLTNSGAHEKLGFSAADLSQ